MFIAFKAKTWRSERSAMCGEAGYNIRPRCGQLTTQNNTYYTTTQ
jgi:hypothetical protein